MTSEFFIYNGLLKRTNEPIILINNRAFLFGDGFFESIIAFNQNIPFFDLHINRINKAIKAFNFETNEIFQNSALLNEQIVYLARKNKLYKTYKIKISIFRETGGMYRPSSNRLNFVIQTFKIETNKFELNKKGLKLGLFKDVKVDFSPFSQFKTLNSLPYIFAQQYAANNNLDDVLLFNSKNEIVEASSSNVFFVIDNEIVTPKIESGCVNGIMRHTIISIANEIKLPIKEINVTLEDINSCSEIFISNSVIGIQYILALEYKRFSNIVSQKVVQVLNKKNHI